MYFCTLKLLTKLFKSIILASSESRDKWSGLMLRSADDGSLQGETMDFTALQALMMSAFVLFDRVKNPVVVAAKTVEAISYVIAQYSLFPREIVAMLTNAQNCAQSEGWSAVADDLARNIAEETGRDTKGKSHYAILVDGLVKDFGIDVRGITTNPATERFLESMFHGLRHPSSAYALGVAYGLECSAVPELRIVYDLVGQFATATDATVSHTLQDFFDRHLDLWEPGHEAGLRLAVAKYLKSQEDQKNFHDGFVATIQHMETWWHGLAEEALS